MKRAKILLTAIIFFSIVGGVSAIKMNRSSDFIYTQDEARSCTVKLVAATTRPNGFCYTITYATTVFGTPCVLLSICTGL